MSAIRGRVVARDGDDALVRTARGDVRVKHAGAAQRALLHAVAHDLDGDLAIELGIVGRIDDAHAAGA